MAKNYWMSRITHHQELSVDLLKSEHILSIGYSDGTEGATKEDIFAKMKDAWWWSKTKQHVLDRYLSMSIGDWVVVPYPGHGGGLWEIWYL